MKTVSIDVPGGDYDVMVGDHSSLNAIAIKALNKLADGRRCLLISDDNVAPLYEFKVRSLLDQAGIVVRDSVAFPAGEASKTLATVERLHEHAVTAGLNRKSFVIALGGGVVGDIAGFVAATYMRGIDFIQVPTSLLAMVDSSVGGKVGVDLASGKNLVGAFHQPLLVLAFVDFLKTLNPREYSCGLAETVKYGMIMDADFFDWLEAASENIINRDKAVVAQLVAHCCKLKAEVVNQDERESGIRAILNYGHTFAHALETLTGYSQLNHGEAVAIGMGMAADLAAALELLPRSSVERQDALLAKFGLPTHFIGAKIEPSKILTAMAHDKKAVDGQIKLVLPTRIGEVKIFDSIESKTVIAAIGGRCD